MTQIYHYNHCTEKGEGGRPTLPLHTTWWIYI